MKNNSSVKSFIQNTSIFFVGTILTKLISFILLPLYTSIVPTYDMGVLDVSITVSTMLISICYFEVWSAILRYLYEGNDENYKNSVLSSALNIFLVSTIVFILVNSLVCWLLGYNYLFWIAAYGFAYASANYFTFVARGLRLNKEFAISGVINTLVHLSSNIILLVLLKMDYSAFYISFILGSFAQVIYLMNRIHFIRRVSASEKNPKLIKEILQYALPLCLNTVAYWAYNSSNRLVYNWLNNNAASGVFSIGSRFGTIIALATTCFTYAWQDLAFSSYKEKEGACKLYIIACSKYQQFLTAATVLFLPLIKLAFPFLIKGDYLEAVYLVPYFVFVAVLSGYYAFIGNVFYAIKETKIISISNTVAAAVNIVFCYPLIRFFGAIGTNLASILAYTVNIMISAIILKKKISFTVYPKKTIFSIIWIILTTAIYLLGGNIIQIAAFILNLIIALLVFKHDIYNLLIKSPKTIS